MDKKNLLTIAMIAMLAFFGYQMFFNRNAAPTTPAPASILSLPAGVQSFAPEGAWAAPETRILGEAKPGGIYKLGLQISNVNAGIEQVQLSDFAQDVGNPRPGEDFTPRMTLMQASAIAVRPFATINVTIHYTDPGVPADKRDVVLRTTRGDVDNKDRAVKRPDDGVPLTWEFVEPKDKNHEVRLRLYVGSKENPDVEIFKVFRIKEATKEGEGYDVGISHEVVNHTAFPVQVTIDQAGPVNMPRDSVQADMRMFQAAAFNNDTKAIITDQKLVAQTSFTVKGMIARENIAPAELGSFNATTAAPEKVKLKIDTAEVEVDSNTWLGGPNGADALFSEDPRHAHEKTQTAEQDRINKLVKDAHDLVWIAEANRFFAVITRPMSGGADDGVRHDLEKKGKDKYIVQPKAFGIASADVVGPHLLPDWEARLDKWVTGVALRGQPIAVGHNTSPEAVSSLSVYMGPKDRSLLLGDNAQPVGTTKGDYDLYSYLSAINFKRGGCTFCVFEPLAIFILGLLDIVHKVTFGNYGIAIMVLVLVMRLLLHPLTRYSQKSIAKMQAKMKSVQPELDRLKKRFPKDKQKYNEEMMKVYKENNINPAGQVLGCLPMLLQMPIWAALYSGLAVDIDLRHAGFIPGWINDLSSPDTLIKFHEPLNVPVLSMLTQGPLNGINLLPILLAVVFFMQTRMQQKTMPKPADETQAQTQMISQYMILLFPMFLYLAPSGLNLYIFASTSGGILDTWLVRRHLRATGILPPVDAPKE